MRSLWVTGLASALLLSCLGAAGCSAEVVGPDDNLVESEEPLTSVTTAERTAAARQDLTGFTYEHLTPTSTAIMRASRWWMDAQDESPRYPKARMCASNVSKVLFLAGLTAIDQEGVRALIGDVRDRRGSVYRMSQNPTEFATTLGTIDGGRLPAGTIVAGMNVNTSAPGDQHIGFVGHQDPDGTVWIYHNNWYRPENEAGQRKAFMVSDENLRRGFPRQWMATPWLKIERNASGGIARVTSLLPAIDDMDPFNANFRVTLAILPQIARELRSTR